MRKYSYFCLLALFYVKVSLATPIDFRVSYGLHNGQPYVFTEKQRLTAGIIKDIADELAKTLKVNVKYIEAPRKREFNFLTENTTHAIIISNPDWVSNSEQYQWSEPIFIGETVLVVNKEQTKPVDKIDDLANMTLGTIRGYYYPVLNPLFENKIAFRSDVKSIELNFSRLNKGWIDGLVDSNISALYHLKNGPKGHDHIEISPLAIDEYPLRSALSPNSPITIEQYNAALREMKKKGMINAILERYGVSKPSNIPH